ncbi:hypothetical protein N7453_010339 [Penicillium expansum]|nr:hypothetical protein N7453_010339 [Penicillium expansum]
MHGLLPVSKIHVVFKAQDYTAVLYELGTIAAPLDWMHSTIFPFFTLEVRGDSGGADAQIQNRNNAANMLNNLRQLTTRARGKEYAQQSFDSVVRVLLATVTQE